MIAQIYQTDIHFKKYIYIYIYIYELCYRFQNVNNMYLGTHLKNKFVLIMFFQSTNLVDYLSLLIVVFCYVVPSLLFLVNGKHSHIYCYQVYLVLC